MSKCFKMPESSAQCALQLDAFLFSPADNDPFPLSTPQRRPRTGPSHPLSALSRRENSCLEWLAACDASCSDQLVHARGDVWLVRSRMPVDAHSREYSSPLPKNHINTPISRAVSFPFPLSTANPDLHQPSQQDPCLQL
jgi:hypothetical protein